MTTVTLAEAKAKLEQLVERLAPGEAIVITQGEKPVAQLVLPAVEKSSSSRRLGFLKGVLEIVSDDDSHLEDFADYM